MIQPLTNSRKPGDNFDGEATGRGGGREDGDDDGEGVGQELDPAAIFFDNTEAGELDLSGDLLSRNAAGPSIHNAEEEEADMERARIRHGRISAAQLPRGTTQAQRSKHAAALAYIDSLAGSRPISYETQRKAFSDACRVADFQTSRVTHIGRAAAVCMVAQNGKDMDSEIRRHGHWNKDVMSNVYMESFRKYP